jgi:hypothetical protein
MISQNHGKRKGIKLGVSVEPIEPFNAPTIEKTTALPQKKGQTSVRIFKEDKNLLEQVLEHLHLPDGLTQPKRMEHLLLWAKDLLEKPLEPVKVEPVQPVQVIPEPETVQPEPIPTPEPINQLIGKIDQLVSILLLQQQSPIPQPSVKAKVLSATPLRPSAGAALTGTAAGQNRSASAPVRPAPISRTPVKPVDDAAATSAHPIHDSAPQANVLSATPAGQERSASAPVRPTPISRTPVKPVDDAAATPTPIHDRTPQPTRPRLSKYETDDLLEHAVTAILNHNDQAPTHDQKWAITINAIKGLGVKSQRKIELFLDDHKEQIDAHHLNHQIDPQTHNLRHRRKYKISDVIVL